MSCIVIETPCGYLAERRYIFDVLLGEFLGLSWQHRETGRSDVRIFLPGVAGDLVLPEGLFSVRSQDWLTPGTMPLRPMPVWDTKQSGLESELVDHRLPVIYGDAQPSADIGGTRIRIPLDIFGSAFFMLTRYEELVVPERDEHERFPAHAAVAFREGFLERPVVDEYVEVLWAAMKRLWPALARRQWQYSVVLTHDVDNPFGVKGQTPRQLFRSLGGDILLRRSATLAMRRLAATIAPSELGLRLDPNNSFDWLMTQSETRGLVSAFYFMTGEATAYDPGYDILAPRVRRLLQRIHARGHEIGLHPSYRTLGDAGRLKAELNLLISAMKCASISQKSIGGRQHYLRWSAECTWSHWEKVGLAYDSTLSYAQHAGFRTGTCREYPVWSLRTRRSLRLKERPLLIMDDTLLGPKYMNLHPEAALAKIERFAKACRLVHGSLVLLWHNDFHLQLGIRRFYSDMLDTAI